MPVSDQTLTRRFETALARSGGQYHVPATLHYAEKMLDEAVPPCREFPLWDSTQHLNRDWVMPGLSAEERLLLIQQVTDCAVERTESFAFGTLGTHLAYLCQAIAKREVAEFPAQCLLLRILASNTSFRGGNASWAVWHYIKTI